MKKKLNTDVIRSELEGSAFFPHHQEEVKPSPLPPVVESRSNDKSNHDTMTPSNHGIMTPRNHDIMTPVVEEDIIETVRKAVKQIGKEAATHRFTFEEKQTLADIEYSYRRQGIRTSENEITRIAINYFVEDYRQNGENSILAKVLKRLNS
jgi:hypothetical protein